MKKFTFVCLAILLIVALTIPAFTQNDPGSWTRAAGKVLREGILYPEPADYFVFFDDFFKLTINSISDSSWILTDVSAGTGTSTITVPDSLGGMLWFESAANEDDGVNIQWHAEMFMPAIDKDLYFEAQVNISEYIESDLCIGLVSEDETPMADTVDGIYFLKADDDSIIYAVSVKNTTAKKTTACKIGTAVGDSLEFVDNVWKKLSFIWNKVNLRFYIDGYLVATHEYASIDSIPTDAELTPTIAFLNGAAAVESLYVDYFWSRQDR